MNSNNKILGKVLFGMLFMIVIPLLLITWAYYTRSGIHLPVPSNRYLIYFCSLTGLFLIAAGMYNLWIFGKGLPMNAFPPKQFVKKGVYAISRNPIYLGTIILSFGISAFLQSSSGFWLVSPLFTLMVIAYTVGFENEHTTKIFGKQTYSPFLSLPQNSENKVTWKERFSVYFLAYLPWLLVYEAFIFIGVPGNSIYSNLSLEKEIPVIEFSALFYLMTYVYAFLIPFIIRSQKMMRRLILDIWTSTLIAGIIYFMVPFVVRQQNFTAETIWGNLLILDRSFDGASASFPAFHVIWAFIAARYFSVGYQKLKWLWYAIAVLISISCLTTGNHSIPDILAGVVVYMLVVYRIKFWDFIRFKTEKLANSWKEWTIGPVRLINHGFYAGAAGFAGIFITGSFLGKDYAIAGFITGLCGIIGAALWAQFIEGSPKLQRPYGYYGSVVGVLIGGAVMITVFPVNLLVLLASFALAAPLIQILGRLRCLVQGCCHGKPAENWLGIHFNHPYSRVNKISGFKGESLHPTQLYSIGTNLLTGLILFRLLAFNVLSAFIIGIYLILNGIGRFIEEYFRGESQTPYWAGMRIYQWIAVINICAGAIFTCIPSEKMIAFQFNVESFYLALSMGLIATIAYGVDFPKSNRRFARLTSV